ncbi:hypothetical protein Sa4125_42260 [Aureimonas sp. SA4125]|uniref:phosphatase PAP2 family protein n=1 Tax=Aureimonas sp. SA4125 TaxID=2826993 RepID=UPI001CC823EE|nr:phosphatase PAP2 family protein [Aureimonas sp. SA4125]BDA86684.1 hypothetical protein Sa4125_42260 [Aureimonas sp. SA4125]
MDATIGRANGRQTAGDRITWLRRNAVDRSSSVAAELARSVDQAPLRLLAYLLAGLSFLFMMFPGIDLAVSAIFAGRDGGFPLAEDRLATGIRDINRLVPTILLPGLTICLLWWAFRPGRPAPVAPHQALFVLSVYILGCGIIVHGLKNFVGRARPDAILPFGGTDAFTVAWQMSGACLRNCSFASGEASSAAAMLAFALLLRARQRVAMLVVLVPLAVIFSSARIAVGKHFLSDVVVSWLILMIVIVALWRVFRHHAADIDRKVAGCGVRLTAALNARFALRGLHRPTGGEGASGRPGRETVRPCIALPHRAGNDTAEKGETDVRSPAHGPLRRHSEASSIGRPAHGAALDAATTLPYPSTLAIEPITHSPGTTTWQTSATSRRSSSPIPAASTPRSS